MTTLSSHDNPFAHLLRCWRERRKLSQLDLALLADVSQRHVSFLESGRAKPSRDMILQLADVLDVPLRERNVLFTSAGFAAIYASRPLDSADMSSVRQALELMLAHHEPYPAIVLDRQWNLLLENRACQRFIALLGKPEEVWQRVDPSGLRNTMRLTFSPLGMQPMLANWPEVSGMLLERLHREYSADPGNQTLAKLLEELKALASVSQRSPSSVILSASEPILSLEFKLGANSLKIFSMLTTFGTALDITADELRVETFFPADELTRQFFQGLAGH